MIRFEGQYNIRPVQLGDIPAVVDVHLSSFQNFFLTFLGRTFLERLYREIALESGATFLVATTQENAVIGFAAGVPSLSLFYKRLARKKWLIFGACSIRAAMKRPSIIPRLLRALKSSKSAGEAACPATLMSIAVAPSEKGRGVGKKLIEHFIQNMMQDGIQKIGLSTDRDNNDATIGFYEKLGFIIAREYQTPEGRWIREYTMVGGMVQRRIPTFSPIPGVPSHEAVRLSWRR